MLIEDLNAGGIRPDKSAVVYELSYALCPFYTLHYFNSEFDLPSFIGCIVRAPKPFPHWNIFTSCPKILSPKAQLFPKVPSFMFLLQHLICCLAHKTVPSKSWWLDDLSNFLYKVLKSLTKHTK